MGKRKHCALSFRDWNKIIWSKLDYKSLPLDIEPSKIQKQAHDGIYIGMFIITLAVDWENKAKNN